MMFKLLIIILLIKCTLSLKKHDQNILEKLIAETSLSNQLEFKKNVFSFIDKVTHIGIKNTCDTRLIQSDVQAKMRQLKSIISTCNGYCRMAMTQDGRIYGGKEFNLDTIWIRVDLTDEVIMSNKAYLGAYYIKFVLSDKYLCVTKEGELYASKTHLKGCLWFNDASKLVSAIYSLHIVIEKTCKISVVNDDYEINDQCTNKLNITNGFSPDLQKFFRHCQTSLIKNEHTQTTQSGQFKQIFMHQTTKQAVITKKTFADDPLLNAFDKEMFNTLTSAMIDKAKYLCKEYLIDEIIYERLNDIDYLYESSLTKIPKLCIDYALHLKNQKDQQVDYTDDTVDSKSNRFKKCYSYRNTPYYKQCLEKNYKCHKYSNDAEKLKKCRKKFGIKMPRKKPTTTN